MIKTCNLTLKVQEPVKMRERFAANGSCGRQQTADGQPSMTEFRTAVETQIDVIGALLLRETHVRFGQTRLGFLWALLQPISHAVLLTALYYVLGRRAPVGGSMPLFFLTGLLPYFLFDKVSKRLVSSFTSDRPPLLLSVVTKLDILLARGIMEGAAWVVVATIIIWLLVVAGYGVWPYDLQNLCGAVAFTFLLGFGVGTVNATMSALFRSWPNIYQLATRPLYICSGVFYLVEQLPDLAHRVLIWNPIVHSIEWFRASFYPAYGSMTLDRDYLISWAICSMVLGLLLERLARRRMAQQ